MLRRVRDSPQRWGLRLATALSTMLAVSSVVLVPLRPAEATTTPAWPVFTVNAFGATVTDLGPGGTSTTLGVASDPNDIAHNPRWQLRLRFLIPRCERHRRSEYSDPDSRHHSTAPRYRLRISGDLPEWQLCLCRHWPLQRSDRYQWGGFSGPDGLASSPADGWRRGHGQIHAERSLRLRRQPVRRNSQHHRWRQYGHSDSLIDNFDRRHRSNLDCDDARRSVRVRVQRGLGNCQCDRQCR